MNKKANIVSNEVTSSVPHGRAFWAGQYPEEYVPRKPQNPPELVDGGTMLVVVVDVNRPSITDNRRF